MQSNQTSLKDNQIINNRSIHDRALEVVGRFKTSESDLINIIQEIDETKAFREKGFTSTYTYCLKFLKLSEPVAYSFMAISRKSKEVPQLKEAIEQDLITTSNAHRIVSVITKDNSNHWLGLAQDLSKAKLEKEIAKINPKVLTPEKIKYVTDERLRLELGISEEMMEDLKRAQEILSQKTKRALSFEETLGYALKEFIKKEDPLQKAQRAVARQKSEKPLHKLCPGRVEAKLPKEIPFERSPLNAALTHQVNLRDQVRCTHFDSTGQRCQERKWLQIHHKIPISHGGQNRLENLTTLCFAHHQMTHHHEP